MFSKLLILLGLLTGALYAQSVTPNQVSSGPLANRPQFCSLNDLYFATDQPADNNSFYCASQNNWVLVSAAVTRIDLTVHNLIVTGTFTGNATTATALQNVPTVCSGGNKPSGVDARGNATGCSAGTAAAGGSNGDIQINVSGSLGGLAAPAGFLVGTTATQTLTHKTFDATNVFPALPYDASGAAAAAVAAIPSATSSVRGLLTAADWVTFNGKDAGGAAAAAQTAAISAAATHSDNASNLSNGTIPAARVPTLNQNTTGSAGSLAAVSNCPIGSQTTGINTTGAAQNCVPPTCVNIMAYGGNAGGSVSNNAAYTAALVAAGNAHACVEFPAGSFNFASNANYTAATSTASVIVKGAGAGVTELLFPNASSGLLFAVIGSGNTVHVRDMSLRTGQAGGSNGIAIVNSGVQTGFAASDIQNVQFYGMDGYAATDFWTVGILADAFSNLNITNVGFVGHPSGTSGLGIAVDLQSTTAVVGAVYNITQLDVAYSNIAVQVNDHIQGVTLSNSNATAVNYGVFVPTGIPYGDNDELMIGPANQFAATVNGISINSPFRHTQVFNNYCLNSGSANCMLFDHYAMTSVIGNQFIQIGPGSNSAIVFDHYSNDDAKVFGNDTQFFTIGLNLSTNSQHVTAFMNNGVGNGVDTSNLGTGNAVSLSAFTGTPTAAFQVVDGFVVHQ